jgi:hypothetical protein
MGCMVYMWHAWVYMGVYGEWYMCVVYGYTRGIWLYEMCEVCTWVCMGYVWHIWAYLGLQMYTSCVWHMGVYGVNVVNGRHMDTRPERPTTVG